MSREIFLPMLRLRNHRSIPRLGRATTVARGSLPPPWHLVPLQSGLYAHRLWKCNGTYMVPEMER